MLPQFDKDAMRRILSAAQAGAQRFAPPSIPSSSSSSLQLRLNAPSFPIPRALTSKLVRMGVDSQSAECISSAITRSVTRLKESFEADFSRRRQQLQLHPQACALADAKFSSIFPATYTTIYNKTVSGWTSYILQEFTPRFLRAQAVHKLRHSKRPFNPLAVPLLERFFSHNAFPSRLEKYDLASSSNMDYRQIHVWFQNRRRRFRKDGKELARPPTKGPLQDFENGVVDALFPDDGTDEDEEDDDAELVLDQQSANIDCPFHIDAPAHAYPIPYPPQVAYDPFPVEPERRHFETCWLRSPQREPTANSTTSVDELISAFHALSLGEDDASVVCAARPARRLSAQRYVLGFATPCPRAPHPALLRRPRRARGQRASGCTNLPAIFAQPADSLRPQSRNGPSSIPSPSSDWPTAQRKRRTLPRRVPKNPSMHHRSSERNPSTFIADRNTRASSIDSVSTSSTSGSDDSPLQTPRLLPSLVTAEDLSPTKLARFEKPATVHIADVLSETSALEWYQEPQLMLSSPFLPSNDPFLAGLLAH